MKDSVCPGLFFVQGGKKQMNEMLKYAYDFTLSEQIVEQAEENRPYDADNEILYSNLYNKINYERVEFLIKRGSQSEKINDFLDDYIQKKSEVISKILLSYLDSDMDIIALAKKRTSDAISTKEMVSKSEKISRIGIYLRRDNDDQMRLFEFLRELDSISRSHIFCVLMTDYIDKFHGNEEMTVAEKLVMIQHKQELIRKQLKKIQKDSGLSKEDFETVLKVHKIIF